MSYCFDIQMRAWGMIRPKSGNQTLAYAFEDLLSTIHSANHRLNDRINQDRAVSKSAERLDEVIEEMETEQRHEEDA